MTPIIGIFKRWWILCHVKVEAKAVRAKVEKAVRRVNQGDRMDIICIIDKSKADELQSKGFQYIPSQIQNQIVYQFVKTPELDNCLNSNYSKQDFFISKNLNF